MIKKFFAMWIVVVGTCCHPHESVTPEILPDPHRTENQPGCVEACESIKNCPALTSPDNSPCLKVCNHYAALKKLDPQCLIKAAGNCAVADECSKLSLRLSGSNVSPRASAITRTTRAVRACSSRWHSWSLSNPTRTT
jgi:hypothetical protein